MATRRLLLVPFVLLFAGCVQTREPDSQSQSQTPQRGLAARALVTLDMPVEPREGEGGGWSLLATAPAPKGRAGILATAAPRVAPAEAYVLAFEPGGISVLSLAR